MLSFIFNRRLGIKLTPVIVTRLPPSFGTSWGTTEVIETGAIYSIPSINISRWLSGLIISIS